MENRLIVWLVPRVVVLKKQVQHLLGVKGPHRVTLNELVCSAFCWLTEKSATASTQSRDGLLERASQLCSLSSAEARSFHPAFGSRCVFFFFCVFEHGARLLLWFAPGLLVHSLRQRGRHHHGVEVYRSRVLQDRDDAEGRRTKILKETIWCCPEEICEDEKIIIIRAVCLLRTTVMVRYSTMIPDLVVCLWLFSRAAAVDYAPVLKPCHSQIKEKSWTGEANYRKCSSSASFFFSYFSFHSESSLHRTMCRHSHLQIIWTDI